MKIEDCKTLLEFFGVGHRGKVWVGNDIFIVFPDYIANADKTSDDTGRALVGCLTGQLKWSKHEPMTAEEENILREIAAWHNNWETLSLTNNGTIYRTSSANNDYAAVPFGNKDGDSKAYEILAPILEKYGEIDLDEYREKINE